MYYDKIRADVENIYEIAQAARAQALDPLPTVEIHLAEDVAARVEGLVSTVVPELLGSGVAARLRELEKEYGKGDELVSLHIAREVFEEKFTPLGSLERKIEAGLRVALGYLTLGIVTAPLEGITHVKIKTRLDGGTYLAVYFSGPIRSAGGTASAFAVLIADYLRRLAGLGAYDPDANEIERYVVELDDYDTRIINLQYRPDPEEIRFLIKNTPVEVSGEPTEELDVISFKDLPRMETNRIRGGMCLVVSMIGLKAIKIFKRLQRMGSDFENWGWITEYEELKKRLHATDEKQTASSTYMLELPGGRPVFSYPSRFGGFRLRYGRARNTGYSCVGVHPATMAVVDDFIALGTQLKLEKPGKGATVAAVDTIEPPVVKLTDGAVVRVATREEAMRIRSKIEKILFVGDILISYGDFVTNARRLLPAGYCEEEWLLEVKKALEVSGWGTEKAAALIGMSSLRLREVAEGTLPTSEEAVKISIKLKVPLHPRYTYFYNELTPEESAALVRYLSERKGDEGWGSKMYLPLDERKQLLEKICVPHRVEGEFVVLEDAHPLLYVMQNGLENSPVIVKDKGGTFVGARMGRPEKAERRLLRGRPHVLFPTGQAGGRRRSIVSAGNTIFTADLAYRICQSCGKRNIFLKCSCGGLTTERRVCAKCNKVTESDFHCNLRTKRSSLVDVDAKRHLESAAVRLGEKVPELVGGVRGLSSEAKIPERLEKGILRAKHGIYVNKDGTTRFDSTNVPLTHFKPSEMGTDVTKLRELGYEKDIYGNELTTSEQILELKQQDVVISNFQDSGRRITSGSQYFISVAKFIDDLLTKFYGLQPFYNVQTKDDLIGHYVVGLAPHTSAGIVGRIIGFTPARVGFAHPVFHAAKRRDCDGDEDSLLLLLDALLNFSRTFLPSSRGSSTMDAPLVLTTVLNPEEVDDQVHDLDIAWSYPLEFYTAARGNGSVTQNVETLKKRIGKETQFNGFGFSKSTANINNGPFLTAYRSLGSMLDKVRAQLALAERINAVDADDVARLVIETHFIKDIRGNMRTFCRQQFRCTNCNEKYRRIPLVGRCTKCGGQLLLTVHQGTVEKYLEPTMQITKKYKVPEYMTQELQILQRRLSAMFGRGQQQSLAQWF